jgi:cation:H+ antiporter
MLLWPSVVFIIGLIILVWSSDRFVDSAAAIAHNFGVPHILIGVTIVSLGTSAPEILVSINAALSDSVNLAMGNALGSNIANIGLVLAVTAFIVPLPITRRVMRIENGILLLVTLAAGWVLSDYFLSIFDGLFLLTGMVIFLVWMFYDIKKSDTPEFEDSIPVSRPNGPALIWFVISLLLLIASARAMVWGAMEIARSFNISELVIGATILALGTSLPELAASVTSALKKHHDIAIGNIIGSNIFNILAVMAVPGLINPSALFHEVFWRDYMFVLGLTLLLSFTLFTLGRSGKPIGRVFASIVGTLYIGYLYINYLELV